jgi:hypothetical protein
MIAAEKVFGRRLPSRGGSSQLGCPSEAMAANPAAMSAWAIASPG